MAKRQPGSRDTMAGRGERRGQRIKDIMKGWLEGGGVGGKRNGGWNRGGGMARIHDGGSTHGTDKENEYIHVKHTGRKGASTNSIELHEYAQTHTTHTRENKPGINFTTTAVDISTHRYATASRQTRPYQSLRIGWDAGRKRMKRRHECRRKVTQEILASKC